MKKQKFNSSGLGLLVLMFTLISSTIYAQNDTSAGTPVIHLQYFNNNNSLQYLAIESLVKKGKIFTPQKGKTYSIFLDDSANLLASVKTNDNGKARLILPPSVKSVWDAKPVHSFIVKEGEQELLSDYTITKSKLSIDTASDGEVHTITATVLKEKDGSFIPAEGVEIKIGIRRLGGILPAGDEETYTTDSSGVAVAELKKTGIPGDIAGKYTLVANVQDNDELGNLVVEKQVAWGAPTVQRGDFFAQRTLWSTRFRTPLWLLFMASGIILGVWGTIFYLVMQFVKIRKLGLDKPGALR